MRRRVLSLICLPLTAIVVAGCGLGSGGSPTGAQLVVTQDFGTRPLADLPQPQLGGSDTVMRMLSRNLKVKTRYGGGFVQTINGISGGTTAGRPVDWFYYVNGVEAGKGATATKVRKTDMIWWDHHDWAATNRIPAVVGSFPAPFRSGVDGKKLPVRVECTPADIPACQTVQDAMTAAGVFAAQGGLQQSITKETLRIIVGPWERIRDDDTARLLESGPQASGVYARPAKNGRSIAILDPRGRTTRTLGPGDGLIAATRLEDGQPVWIVTAVDVAGVAAASRAMDQGNLKDHFALAVDAGRAVAVPEVAPGR
ncbi:MAG: hypothetical protein JWO02_2776 [Solirubrobacterales bacterium]|nr:hypothetical protein [Solirubrobacterales bacterium]